MSVRQQDSAIKFAEGYKSLTERYNFKVKESETFKNLWESEKENRAKDKADFQSMINGYAAIETSQRIEIVGLKKENKKLRNGNVIWKGLTIAGGILSGILLATR